MKITVGALKHVIREEANVLQERVLFDDIASARITWNGAPARAYLMSDNRTSYQIRLSGREVKGRGVVKRGSIETMKDDWEDFLTDAMTQGRVKVIQSLSPEGTM